MQFRAARKGSSGILVESGDSVVITHADKTMAISTDCYVISDRDEAQERGLKRAASEMYGCEV